MKLYLSGPITGMPNDNRIAFQTAADKLRKQGHEVFSPIEHDVPEASTVQAAWTLALCRDIVEVATADGIAVLELFHQSKGAMLECHTALGLKKPVVCIPGQPIGWPMAVEEFVRVSLLAMWRGVDQAKFTHHDDIAKPSANQRQVGGAHYGLGRLQHWDIVSMFDLDYFQGQITKYVMRFRKKNGVEDLEKAGHFLEKLLELEKAKMRTAVVGLEPSIPITFARPMGVPVTTLDESTLHRTVTP